MSSAEANIEIEPSRKPKPGPNTRPARISRKKTVSMPAVPAPSGRSAALIAARMPSIATVFASMPPSDSSAATSRTSNGMVAMK